MWQVQKKCEKRDFSKDPKIIQSFNVILFQKFDFQKTFSLTGTIGPFFIQDFAYLQFCQKFLKNLLQIAVFPLYKEEEEKSLISFFSYFLF